MDEPALIKRAQNGDTGCFSQLVSCYQLRLYSYLLARCHHPEDADDVLQDTFVNAFQYIRSYQPKWAFSTWLFTIARRLLHAQKKRYFVPIEDTRLVTENTTTHLAVDPNNFWRLIKKYLTADCYDALWFHYKEDKPIKQVAAILKKSESWVKTNLHRSKMKLRRVPALSRLLEEL